MLINISNPCRAVNLEVLSFSHTTTVAKDFFGEIRNMMPSAESSAPPLSYSLKTLFLPVADGTDFEDVIRHVREISNLLISHNVSIEAILL